jgi:hypothetical protein
VSRLNGKRGFCAAVVVVLLVAPALAQQHPNVAKGFKPDQVFTSGVIDHVNMFNGNLNLNIPISIKYPAGGNLDYSVALTFGGNNWISVYTTEWVEDETHKLVEKQKNWTKPTARTNAGMGWLLSLGRLIPPAAEDEWCGCWVYQSPDGAEHEFYNTLHPGMAVTPDVFYTHDGEYLKLRVARDQSQVVISEALDSPDGTLMTFDPNGRLQSISDRSISNAVGNTVTINYDDSTVPPPSGGTCGGAIVHTWKISDTTGRNHYVYFRGRPYYPDGAVCEADFAVFGTSTHAVYTFDYVERVISRQWIFTQLEADPSVGSTVLVPLLTNIGLPDGTSYDILYDIGHDDAHGLTTASPGDPTKVSQPSYGNPGGFSGQVISMTTPSRAQFAWDYTNYALPLGPDPLSPCVDTLCVVYGNYQSVSDGVWHKTLTNGLMQSTWTYGSTPLIKNTPNESGQNGMENSVLAPDGKTSFAYFESCISCTVTGEDAYYGLPFYFGLPSGDGRYLSGKLVEDGVTAQRTYVAYEGDTYHGVTGIDLNPRLTGSTTIWYDETTAGAPESNRQSVAYSDFDGLGHFRTTTSNGSRAGAAADPIRVDTVAYNRKDDLVDPTAFDSGDYPSDSPLQFNLPDPVSPDSWRINTYSSKSSTWNGATAKTLFLFDANGFLARQRVLKNAMQASADDLLTVNTYGGPADTGAWGSVVEEEFSGGNKLSGGGVVATGIPTDALRTLTPPTPAYRIRHTYQNGSLAKTYYEDPATNAGVGFNSVDNTVDQNTGLVSSSRDSAGVTTTFDFDVFGRLKSSTPAGSATTTYTYSPADANRGPQVTIEAHSAPSGMLKQVYGFDHLGHPRQLWNLLPDGGWAYTETVYDLAGRVTKKSMPDRVTASGEVPATLHWTTFDAFDAFDRVTGTTAPDTTVTTITYAGTASKTTTASVATSVSSDGTATSSNETTTETYDSFNDLVQVKDENGLLTNYAYDITGHLASVCMNPIGGGCGQVRSFTYDGRGFLADETVPELIDSNHPGQEHIQYAYDARGHVIQKLYGRTSFHDEQFSYDPAERLLAVSARDPGSPSSFRIFKEYTYASQNSGSNRQAGKLMQSVRHNYDSSGDLRVAQSYVYADAAGRLTKKTTELRKCDVGVPCTATAGTGWQTVETDPTYDDFGEESSMKYPFCTSATTLCAAANFSHVQQQFAAGALTSVATADSPTDAPTTATGSLQYLANGMVGSVVHEPNGTATTDTYAIDPTTLMPRPASISLGSAATCISPVITGGPSVTASDSQSATLTVIATGSDLSYQWYANGSAIAGATGSSYAATGIDSTTAFEVHVYNGCGMAKRSTTITVNTCPGVSTAPRDVAAIADGSVTLTAQPIGSPNHFTWYKGARFETGTPIPGCVDKAVCPVPAPADAGSSAQYWAMTPASGTCPETYGGTITVTAIPACHLDIRSFTDSNPTRTNAGDPHILTLTVDCTDASTSYDWTYQTFDMAAPAPYAPDSSTTATVSPGVTTTFTVTVTNSGVTASASVTVHVLSCNALHIVTQPADQYVGFGEQAHFTVDVGPGSFSYQWYQGTSGDLSSTLLQGPNLQGLNNGPNIPSYDTGVIQFPDDKSSVSFWVRVSGNGCFIDSRTAVVRNCPRIQTQPQNVVVTPLMNRAVLRVETTGSDLKYQWYFGDARDTTNPVSWGRDPDLVINVNETTNFWVQITGPCGPFNSAVATVKVCHPPGLTQQPAAYTLDVFGQPTSTLTADSDGSNAEYDWYEASNGDDIPTTLQVFTSGKTASLSGFAPGIHYVRVRVYTADHDCWSDSSVAVVEVCAPPSIVSGLPTSVTVPAGTPANFIIALDQPGATIDWYLSDPNTKPAPPIYGTGAVFEVTPDHTTTYWLRTDNGTCQSAAETASKITVYVCTPKITAVTVTPSSQITEGTQVTLHVDAVGDATPVSAAWYTGTNGPTTLVGDGATVMVTPTADTTYWAEVSAPCPQIPYVVTSAPVTISVCHPPQITGSTPSAQVVAVNEYINLWATTTGTNVQAHWYKGAVGDTTTPVTPTNFPGTLADAGDYWVNVSGDCGSAVTATAHVDVCIPPVITSQSSDQQVQSGSTATLSVTATGTNLTYSWMRINADSTETQVGTSASYTTDPLTVATQYYVIVTSQGHCPTPRANVTVSVCSPPQFTTGPQTVYINGGGVNLGVPVDDPNATVTWYATDPRLGAATVVTSPVNPTTQTTYWAQAKDGICLSGVTSETVVVCTPQFTSVTPSQTITAGNSITLACAATGPSISYKWWTGTTSPTTQIASTNSVTVNPTSDTNYWAEAQCSCPITTYPLREEVAITVCHPAQIAVPPQPTQNVTVGDFVGLVATATGTGVQVHWYKGAVGDKSTPFTVSNGGFYATANDSGTYWVEAAGTCGTATASTVVDVCVPPVITTQPVGTQIQSGSSTTLTVAATGTSLTYDWYVVNADNTQTLVGSGTSFNSGALTADTKYVARVTSRGRCYTSSNQVTVSVCAVPQITYVTPSQTVGMQQPVTLYVSASGTSMQYEWKNLSTNQVIATTYTVNVTPSATTSYSVRVYSGICSATSATVTLTVCGPTITQQPASPTIAYGSSATLSVAAVGDGTITAQWYRGVSPDTSAPVGTGLSVTVQPATTTRYWVRVSTPCRSVDSASALVTVSGCAQPVISAQSGNTAAVSDQSVTLSVTAQNTWDMHYQWYLWDSSSSIWSAISGATSTTYVESPTTVSNTYMVSLWNSCGLSTNSSSMAITRTPACYPAAITTQPHSVTFNAGSSVTFTAAASGTNVHYQWVAADPTGGTFVPLSGQTSSTLTVTPQSQSASYYVIATASCGAAAVSSTVTATRNCTPPASSSQTQSQTIRKNTWVTLQYTATGTATIGYTWYASTTGSNFTQVGTGTAIGVQPQVTTYYYAVASNSCGSVTSNYITITVTQCAPTISTQPASQTINSTQSVTLSVVATSDQLHYQWYISTGGAYSPISNATAATLTYSPTTTSYFYVYVYNDCGNVNSNTATVTVTPACYPPTVNLTVPSTGQFDESGQAIITASFTGTNPTLTYYRTPPNGQNPVVVTGPGTATQVTVYYAGVYTYWYYYVVATNACGTATSSWRAIGQYNPDAGALHTPGSSAVQWAGATSTEGISPLRTPWGVENPVIEQEPRTAVLNQ